MSVAQSSWVKTVFAAFSLGLIRCPPLPRRPISTLNSGMPLLPGFWACGSLRRLRAAATRRETCHQLYRAQYAGERSHLLVLFLWNKDAEGEGDEEPMALRYTAEEQRADAEGRPPGPGTPLLGVWWCILPKRIQRDTLPGPLPRKSGVFSPEAFLQRPRGFLCLLLSSGGVQPLPAHLTFPLLPR